MSKREVMNLAKILEKDGLSLKYRIKRLFERSHTSLYNLGCYEEAEAMRILVDTAGEQQKLLRNIIDNLKVRSLSQPAKKTREERPLGTVVIADEEGRIRIVPRDTYYLMLEQGRDITLVKGD